MRKLFFFGFGNPKVTVHIRPKVTIHKCAETIQGKGGNYMKKYGTLKSLKWGVGAEYAYYIG